MIMLSLIFGALSWGLALAALLSKRKKINVRLIMASLLSCCASAMCPMFEILGHVSAGRPEAVIDEIRGIIIGVAVMLGIAMALNFVALRKLSK